MGPATLAHFWGRKSLGSGLKLVPDWVLDSRRKTVRTVELRPGHDMGGMTVDYRTAMSVHGLMGPLVG